jgi:CheY-like chemotaxis protein
MPGRILIADDSPTIRRLIRGILQFKGYEIAEASTGDEAIEAIRREAGALQLAILDLKMPGPDGLEVLAQVRAAEAAAGTAEKPLPVIILTAEEDEAEHAIAVGASHFLLKPFEPVTLLQIVQELIG